jgi:hypothetical protein
MKAQLKTVLLIRILTFLFGSGSGHLELDPDHCHISTLLVCVKGKSQKY